MNCMRIDPNYTTSKNGKHRKELKAFLRNIYDPLGRYPGYRTIMTALYERGYKCGRQMARELVHCYTRNTTPRPASGIVLQCCEFDSVRVARKCVVSRKWGDCGGFHFLHYDTSRRGSGITV